MCVVTTGKQGFALEKRLRTQVRTARKFFACKPCFLLQKFYPHKQNYLKIITNFCRIG